MKGRIYIKKDIYIKYRINIIVVNMLFFFLSLIILGAKVEDGQSQRTLPNIKLDYRILNLLETKKWTEAIAALRDTYESSGSNSGIKYYLAFCHEQLATNAFNKKNYQEAINQLELAILYVDDEPDLYLGLGICHFHQSDYFQAENNFKQVLNLDANNFLAHKKLGEISYLDGDNYRAEYHWEEALKINPSDSALKNRLISLQKLLELSSDFATEMDSVFFVHFDGKKNTQLSKQVIDILSEIYLKVGRELNFYPKRQIQVVLLSNHQFFDITESPDWAGGVYEGHIKLPIDNYNKELLKIVLCHEYVHAMIYDRLSHRCPWWLNEGLAQYFSGDEQGNKQKMELASAFILKQNVPPLMNLPGNFVKSKNLIKYAYALSLSAVHFFFKKFSEFSLQNIFDLMASGKSLKTAFEEITSYSFKEFENEWKLNVMASDR